MQFAHPFALRTYLRSHNISINLWGQQGSRSVADLYHEIRDGECQLRVTGSGPVRVVEVVVALIPKTLDLESFLKITDQVLPNGSRRSRDHWPGGKKKASESALQAIVRELSEELQWDLSGQNLPLVRTEEKDEASASYPGLKCVYKNHIFMTPPNPDFPWHKFMRPCAEGGSQWYRWAPASSLPFPPSDLP